MFFQMLSHLLCNISDWLYAAAVEINHLTQNVLSGELPILTFLCKYTSQRIVDVVTA